jgi:hypothetical protein
MVTIPATISYGGIFNIEVRLEKGAEIFGDAHINIIGLGFYTHGQTMGQRLVKLGFETVANSHRFKVNAPRYANVIPPGVYIIPVIQDDRLVRESGLL